MTPRSRRAAFTATAFLAVCAVAGSFLEGHVGAQTAADESHLNSNLKSFTDVFSQVEQNYAEPITGEKADTAIYDGAIPGMLHVLDPHSNFYDPKAYAHMREDQRGHYYGVGMTIVQQNGKVWCVYPMEDGPSFRAGIRPADIIVAIDGKSTDGMTSDQVAKILKGPKGTHVQVSMQREGQPKPLLFDLIRDDIAHPSVDLKYEIRPGVGYVHLLQFQETSAREVVEAINSFGNLKGLVLDLRSNPGGLLDQAVDICDHLLGKGQTIVSQKGRAFPDRVYTANHGNGGKSFPIVVLVNRSTASAAEIVSGALQDHDRALIVGETTFGKGLVQTVYDMGDRTMALALTTYHYYTPSGRLIQRNYTGLSLYDYYSHGGQAPTDTANREVKLTDSGRTVYGGGGITPDEKIESPKSNRFEEELAAKSVFFHYAAHYLASRTVDRNFQADAAVLGDFKQFLTSQKIDWSEEDFKSAETVDWVKASIRENVITSQFGETQGLRMMADWDPVIQKAIGFLPEAQQLLEKSHKAQTAENAARSGGLR